MSTVERIESRLRPKAASAGRPAGLLSKVAAGARARVCAVSGTDEVSVRLLEMGLTPGVEVDVLGMAPWGGPIILGLRDYRLSVRRSEAARVEVHLL